ncbi:response regulator [Candidatus Woesebacteria bacterium]|nr:response regulator [Candidatus Woesebacteria bacterium]
MAAQQTEQNSQSDPTAVNNPSQGNSLPAQPVEQTAGLPRILIVEDDPILGRMYSEKFKSEGYEVISAQDGEAGLQKAKEGNIDMILLDVMLPRMSGIDLLEQLRKDDNAKDTKVIALTNLADQSEKDRAIALGVKDYLVKAMQTPEQVVTKVNSLLGR